MKYKIRKAKFEDAKGIAKVHIQAWRETYKGIIDDDYLKSLALRPRIKSWEEDLKNSKNIEWTFVAETEEGEIVGFASGGPARGKYATEFKGELYAIYLLKKAQKNKLGYKLMKKLCAVFIKNKIDNMFTVVLADNNSKDFYIKYGGKLLTTKKEKIGRRQLIEEYYGWENFDEFLKKDDQSKGTIKLRKLKKLDLPLFLKWWKDPELITLTSGHFEESEEKLTGYFFSMIGAKNDHHYIIQLEDRLIGHCALIHKSTDSFELTIVIGEKEYWSKGYGTEAIKKALTLGFGKFDYKKATLEVRPENIRAIKAYQACGFVKKGLKKYPNNKEQPVTIEMTLNKNQ